MASIDRNDLPQRTTTRIAIIAQAPDLFDRQQNLARSERLKRRYGGSNRSNNAQPIFGGFSWLVLAHLKN
jgi:hypothetical protein